MGRRKIEIQPITHERNRSVTFLKRKNGLFKKAYELGVLCSVDVAVIIFEERPGHHVKLYQYCSSDIHDIVQRHLRHDGEKDTRGPQDFSGNNSSKLDDGGDGDDDDGDDDDDIPSRKRRHDGKLKPPADMVPPSMDYASPNPRSLSIPQPPPLSLHIGGPPAGGGSTHPISNDRSIGMRDTNKRSSRLSLHAGHSRSPSDPVDPGSGNYSYYPGQGSASFNRPSQYGHHPSQHHGHSQSGPPHHGSSNQYQPFFPVSSSHQSPPPSFIPLQSDFPRGPPSRGGGSNFGLPPRSNSTSSSSYDPPGMYSNMMRNPPPSSQSSGPGGGPGGGGDLFAAFLDADEQSRHQNQAQQGSGLVGLEWPVHNSGGGGNSASSAPSVPSSAVSNNASTGPSSAHPEGPSNNNWLDLFSNNNNVPPGRDAISWERGAAGGGEHRGEMSDMFSGERARAGSSASAGSAIVMGISGGAKRSKAEEDASLNVSMPSPAGLNSRGNELQKEGAKDVG